MDYFVLHTLLLVTNLLLMTSIICYYCTNHMSKQKKILAQLQYENEEK